MKLTSDIFQDFFFICINSKTYLKNYRICPEVRNRGNQSSYFGPVFIHLACNTSESINYAIHGHSVFYLCINPSYEVFGRRPIENVIHLDGRFRNTQQTHEITIIHTQQKPNFWTRVFRKEITKYSPIRIVYPMPTPKPKLFQICERIRIKNVSIIDVFQLTMYISINL